MKNIVVIGMPGSGKTTISHRLSGRIRKPIFDVDEYLTVKHHSTIAQMFQISEQYFRDLESAAVNELSQKQGIIIATGGGVIKRKENMDALKENGVVFFLDRDPDKIVNGVDIEGRPLLREGAQKIYDLYEERLHLYREYADVVIENNGSIMGAVESIIDYCYENNII